jgi:hypothetical protein
MWRTGHRSSWSEKMIWSGTSGTVYFCDCGEQFWPLTKKGPYPDWRDNPVKRERPE